MKGEPRGRVDINWFSPDVNGEYKFTRRMYQQHKNMQSGGFYLGDDSIAKKYVERGPIKVDYKEELLKKLGEVAYSDRRSTPIIQPMAAEDSSSTRIGEDTSVDRTPPRRHIARLHRAFDRQPFEEVVKTKPRITDSPLRAAGSYSLSKPSNPKTNRSYGNSAETPTLPASGPRSVSPFFQAVCDTSPSPSFSTVPLGSKNSSNQFAHELSNHSLFKGPRYTKKNPKLRMDNPITGIRHVGVPPEYYNRRQDT